MWPRRVERECSRMRQFNASLRGLDDTGHGSTPAVHRWILEHCAALYVALTKPLVIPRVRSHRHVYTC